MKTKLLLGLALVLGSCVLALTGGCSTTETSKNYSSVETDRLIAMVNSATNYAGWTGFDYFDYSGQLNELQKRADILIEAKALNFQTVKIIRAENGRTLPAGEIPLSDLPKYFPPGNADRKLKLAVYYAPWDDAFVTQTNGPDPDAIMRNMVNTMKQHGVENVMIEATWHGLWGLYRPGT